MTLSLLPLLCASALAQEDTAGIDAHGFHLAPNNDGQPLDPLELWRARSIERNTFGVQGLFEYASAPLVFADGDDRVTAVVDDLVALNLAASFAPFDDLSIGVGLPVFFASQSDAGPQGAAVGDMRVNVAWVPLDEGRFQLVVVPFLDLPTGAAGKNLGSSGFGWGGVLGGRVPLLTDGDDTKLEILANLGVNGTPVIDVSNLQGGAKLLAGLGVGFAPTKYLGLRAELVLEAPFKANPRPGTETPGEINLSAHGRYDGGFGWTLGGAFPVTHGASAAAWRVFAGAGFGVGKPKDTDKDGIVDRVDKCIKVAETKNGWKDDDGCPDALSTFDVTVVDEDGVPIPGSIVNLAGNDYTADAKGRVHLEGMQPGTPMGGTVKPGSSNYLGGEITTVNLAEGANSATAMLAWAPGKVRVTVKDEKDRPVDANVYFKGPTSVTTTHVGSDGVEVYAVPRGTWVASVVADGYGAEKRDVVVSGQGEALVQVTLKKAKAIIKLGEIAILEQVQFDTAKATIKPESFGLLEQIAGILLDHPEVRKVEVQGHTDDKGKDDYNMNLSQQRVESVVKFLVDRGVDGGRLNPKGYGETAPLVPNTNEKNRARNRRVAFKITEQDKFKEIEVPVPPTGPGPQPGGK